MPLISLDEARAVLGEAMADDLALFVGAGISIAAPSSCPSWLELTRDFIRSAVLVGRLEGPPTLMSCLELLPERMMATFRRPEHTFQILQDVLGEDVFEGLALLRTGDPNTNHFLICGYLYLGALRAVVTTNFDQHLEQVMQIYESVKESPSPSRLPFIKLRGKDVSGALPVEASRLLWMIHGSLGDLSSIVASVGSTGRALAPDAVSLLRSLMAQHILVVVGYSGNDEDIMDVFLSPETISSARGIVWQAMDSSQLHAGSAAAQLEAAYGSKFKAVITTAEEIFGWIFDPILVGPPELQKYTDAIEWLTHQWRILLLQSMTPETKKKLRPQLDRELTALARNGRVRADCEEPGSVSWRITYDQLVLTMLEGPAGKDVLIKAASSWAAGYRSNLMFLRESAPGMVLQFYPRFSILLVIARLLLSCRCYDEALHVSTIGLDDIATSSALSEDEIWEIDIMGGGESAVKECYRQFRAVRAIVLICIGNPRAALKEVQFARSLIARAFISGAIHRCRSLEQLLFAEMWALIRLSNDIEYTEIRHARERLRTVERGVRLVGAEPHLHPTRGECDRDLFKLVYLQEGPHVAKHLIDEELVASAQAGDSLRCSLLRALRAELCKNASPANLIDQQLEDSYREILRLGAIYELVQLCKSASGVASEGQRGRWLERLTRHRIEVLDGLPDAVQQSLRKLLDRP